MGKCKRLLTMVLAAALCCTVLPLTAFAGGGPEDGSDKVLEYWSQGSTPPQDIEQSGQPSTDPAPQQTPQQGDGDFFFSLPTWSCAIRSWEGNPLNGAASVVPPSPRPAMRLNTALCAPAGNVGGGTWRGSENAPSESANREVEPVAAQGFQSAKARGNIDLPS